MRRQGSGRLERELVELQRTINRERQRDSAGASLRLPLVGRDHVLGTISFTTIPPRRLGDMEVEMGSSFTVELPLHAVAEPGLPLLH